MRECDGIGTVRVHHIQEALGQVLGRFTHALQQLIEFLFVYDAISILIHSAEALDQRLQILLVTAQLVVQHTLYKRLVADAFTMVLILQLVLLLASEVTLTSLLILRRL